MGVRRGSEWVEVEFVAYHGERIVDDQWGETPMRFALGSSAMPASFQEAIAELDPGDAFAMTLESDRAFGPRNPHLVQKIPVSALPPDAQVGHAVSARVSGTEVPIVFHIVSIEADRAKLDGNHPFAGMALRLEGRIAARGCDR